jgi:deoxyribose-phosphate aldolase
MHEYLAVLEKTVKKEISETESYKCGFFDAVNIAETYIKILKQELKDSKIEII